MNLRIQNNIELAESFIPGSVAYRKSNLDKANEVLKFAKSLKRKVRYAKPNECEFSKELEQKRNAPPAVIIEREDGRITAKDAEILFGIPQATIQVQRRKGLIEYIKENRSYYFYKEDIQKIDFKTRKKPIDSEED